MPTTSGRPLLAAALALAALLAPGAARAFEAFGGRLQVHGYVQNELRVISKNYSPSHDWYLSQDAFTLDLELEASLLDEPWGPFDSIGAYTRVEVRYECIWQDGCGIFDSRKYFGNDSSSDDLAYLVAQPDTATHLHAPSRVFTNGYRRSRAGFLPLEDVPHVHRGTETIPFFDAPAYDPLTGLGTGNLVNTLASIDHIPLVEVKRIREGFDEGTSNWTLGPVNRDSRIHSLGELRTVQSFVPVRPLQPQIPVPGTFNTHDPRVMEGLWAPHYKLRQKIPDIDDDGRGFNLSTRELAWNHGASQDEKELKEAYLDLEMFDGRLFLRLGKQTIVWGKTELFRNQDQFNPQDVALSSLPDLETSRIPLWAVRGIYSLYDVGPFEDVRVELAAILDDFQPIDAGTCGEPYAPFLVCAGSFAFFSHGLSSAGIAGVVLPPDPWDSSRGLEVGARVEWRFDRYAFALTDFYGYSDIPHVNRFADYARNVDPVTGEPLDAKGRSYQFEDLQALQRQALLFDPQNRSLFEFGCSVSVGVAGQFIPALAQECALSVFNSTTPIASFGGVDFSVAQAFAQAVAGTTLGATVVDQVAGLPGGTTKLVRLNGDPDDPKLPTDNLTPCTTGGLRFVFTPTNDPNGRLCLTEFLTKEQQALLGCGPFYGTNCDEAGFSIYLSEASVILQAFPMFEPGGPVGTRLVNGELYILPGARGPGDRGYDPDVDGCVDPAASPQCAGQPALVNPKTGEIFHSEMEALSYNFLTLVAAFGSTNDPQCDPQDPFTCSFVQAIFATTGVTRPDLRAGGNGRFGRRDFVWASGGPAVLEFQKRNVLGLAVDFAEDWSKTNWSLEATWVRRDAVPDIESRSLFRKADIYNLTVSIDRPTFVNFLNANRTFFFNTQLFFQYVSQSGPMDILGTFTIQTGFFQDRLLNQITFVHDVQSNSGAIIYNLTYRFTSNASVILGLAGFYGNPGLQRQAAFPIALQNNGGDFKDASDYSGLTVLSDRDEANVVFRYTF